MTTAFDPAGSSSLTQPASGATALGGTTALASSSGPGASSEATAAAARRADAAAAAPGAGYTEAPASFDAWLAELAALPDQVARDQAAAAASALAAELPPGDPLAAAAPSDATDAAAGWLPWLPATSQRPAAMLEPAGAHEARAFAAAGAQRKGAAAGPLPTTLPLELLGSGPAAVAARDRGPGGEHPSGTSSGAVESLGAWEFTATRSALDVLAADARGERTVTSPNADARALAALGVGALATAPPSGELGGARPLPSASSLPAPPSALHSPVGVPGWSDELGAVLNLMVDRGEQTATLRLAPEHLGPLEVRIAIREGEASIWFGASQAETRQALESSLSRLRELLAGTGLALAQADVSGRDPRAQGQGGRDAAGSGNARDRVDSQRASQAAAGEDSLRVGAAQRLARLLDVYA